ncbi:MAG: DNA primase [Rikenellaceae bacterium]
MIDKETVDRIYAAANIVDIIGDYVTLKRKGVNYQACCPFHNEKTPSFVVSPSKGVFKCFGCGESGNAVTFVMKHEAISYPEALKMVAKRYGIEVQERELSEEELQRNDDRESMFTLNAWAYDYFMNYLHNDPEGISVGLSYFRQSRGFSEETIRKFGLGFCPAKGDTMSQTAIKAGYKAQFLTATGLSIESDRDKSLFDRFRDRVMFPVHNISGRIVAFGGRTLRTDKKVAKYQNSPESEIYSKSRELYGLFFAKKAIQQHDKVIMVEGYTDVISMHQSGIENVVSSSGTSLTVEQVRLLNRFTQNITIIYDGDAAGVKAAIRGIDIVLKEGMNVRIVSLPVEHDPDSFARAHTAEEVHQYVNEHEEDFITFKAKLLLGEAKGDPIKRSEMIADMIGSISNIPDPIRRSVFAKECSRIMDIDENVLISEIARKIAATQSNDQQTANFIRNQQRRNTQQGGFNNTPSNGSSNGGFAPPPDDLFIDDPDPYAPYTPSAKVITTLDAGSTVEILEKELLTYLLKYGHQTITISEGTAQTPPQKYNVAALIFAELQEEAMEFTNPAYSAILKLYEQKLREIGEGNEVPTETFTANGDPDVCSRAIEIITEGDNYIPSRRWNIHHEGLDPVTLARGVKKAITLYKSKALETMIKQLQIKLQDPTLTEEEQNETLQQFAHLNTIKVQMAKHLNRLIL